MSLLVLGNVQYMCVVLKSERGTASGYLLIVDEGDRRTVTVWNWRQRTLIARTVVTEGITLFRYFVLLDHT